MSARINYKKLPSIFCINIPACDNTFFKIEANAVIFAKGAKGIYAKHTERMDVGTHKKVV